MRAQDLHVIRSKDDSRQAPADGAPRRYRFYAMHTKNDKLGTGPAHNREWYVPCICLETLDDAHKGKWARDLKRNPHLPCANFCPYQIVVDYLSICDDPAGGLRQMEIRQDPTLPPLAFARARSTTGNRRFLKVPLGINMIREAIPACNKRLPDNLKIAKATGQTGRHTFTSAGLNSGCSESIVALGSKHKSIAIRGYLHASKESTVAPMMSMVRKQNAVRDREESELDSPEILPKREATLGAWKKKTFRFSTMRKRRRKRSRTSPGRYLLRIHRVSSWYSLFEK
jgi:hypothetical protein